jgi:hypothetical protein
MNAIEGGSLTAEPERSVVLSTSALTYGNQVEAFYKGMLATAAPSRTSHPTMNCFGSWITSPEDGGCWTLSSSRSSASEWRTVCLAWWLPWPQDR